MPKPAVFFDRDNTLIASDGYLSDPAHVRLIPGAAEAVARAHRLGFAVVIVSNQSGVARGLFTEESIHAVNRRLDELLQAENPSAIIDRHEFCPFHPAAALQQYRLDSDLRKPRPGMFLKARRELKLAEGGWCVGDAPRDIAAGKAAGCRTILFRPQGLPPSPAAEEPITVPPDFEVTELSQAMDIIEHETRANAPHLATPAPDTAKTERLLEAVLAELKRANKSSGDFSVTKLLAGILQVINLALLLLAYLSHSKETQGATVVSLLVAVVLQCLVTSLLLMGKNR